MGELYAELWVSLKRTFSMNEERTLQKWAELISRYQSQGIDVSNDTPAFSSPTTKPTNELWVGLGSGLKTQKPNYDAMYMLFGEFIQFLYENMLFNGVLEIKLERTGASG